MDRCDLPTTMTMLTPGVPQSLQTMASPAATFDRRSFWRLTKVAVVIVAALEFCGCAEPSAKIEKTVRAGGVLVHRGAPLAHYQVMFQPLDGRRPASGISD